MSPFEIVILTAAVVYLCVKGDAGQLYGFAGFATLTPIYFWAFRHFELWTWIPCAWILLVAIVKDREMWGIRWRAYRQSGRFLDFFD